MKNGFKYRQTFSQWGRLYFTQRLNIAHYSRYHTCASRDAYLLCGYLGRLPVNGETGAAHLAALGWEQEVVTVVAAVCELLVLGITRVAQARELKRRPSIHLAERAEHDVVGICGWTDPLRRSCGPEESTKTTRLCINVH